MAPAPRGLVDYFDVGLFADVLGEIPTRLLHHLIVNATRRFKFLAVLAAKSDIGRIPIPSTDSKGQFATLWNKEGGDDDPSLRIRSLWSIRASLQGGQVMLALFVVLDLPVKEIGTISNGMPEFPLDYFPCLLYTSPSPRD